MNQNVYWLTSTQKVLQVTNLFTFIILFRLLVVVLIFIFILIQRKLDLIHFTVMELLELCKLSEKYAMDDEKSNKSKAGIDRDRKGLTYSRSIRKKEKRMQRHRSKSLPAIPIVIPPKPFSILDLQSNTFDENDLLAKGASDDEDEENDTETDLVRVRHFSTTMKGLVNKGDLRKDSRRDSGFCCPNTRRDSTMSVASVSANARRESVFTDATNRRYSTFVANTCTPLRRTSCITDREYSRRLNQRFPMSLPGSQESILNENPTQYSVLVLGACGVGKSAVISQFMTSDFLGASDVQTDSVEDRTSISVILNKEESMIDLIETNNLATFRETVDEDIDAYMIVYSCADRNSFKAASSALARLKEDVPRNKTIMIVANKVDLARKRQVLYQEGRVLANTHNCKYIETSAALNHNIDELLAGVLSQIRLLQYTTFASEFAMGPNKKRQQKGLTRVLKTALRGVFGKKEKMSKCENLYEI